MSMRAVCDLPSCLYSSQTAGSLRETADSRGPGSAGSGRLGRWVLPAVPRVMRAAGRSASATPGGAHEPMSTPMHR